MAFLAPSAANRYQTFVEGVLRLQNSAQINEWRVCLEHPHDLDAMHQKQEIHWFPDTGAATAYCGLISWDRQLLGAAMEAVVRHEDKDGFARWLCSRCCLSFTTSIGVVL